MGWTEPVTTVYAYDDNDPTNHTAGTPHSAAEASAVFADVPDLGTTGVPSIRFKQSAQIGDAGTGTAVTTWTETSKNILFDLNKTLLFRTTQASSWFLNLGTKIGTGNKAGGAAGVTLGLGASTTFRGTCRLYGSRIVMFNGNFAWSPLPSGPAGEAINCYFESMVSAGTSPFVIGNSVSSIVNMYNCTFSHVTSNQMMTNFFVDNAELITMICPAPSSFISSGSAGLKIRGLRLIGSPTVSDLKWNGAGAVGWTLYAPVWTNNAPKFTTGSGGSPNISGATVEYRSYGCKSLTKSMGAAIPGITVRVTDVVGNQLVDGSTDANGELLVDLPVMDHYISSGTTYAQRHRGPYRVQVNDWRLPGWNSACESRDFQMKMPGHETVGLASGTFGDAFDVFELGPHGGVITDDIPVGAPGELCIEMEVP